MLGVHAHVVASVREGQTARCVLDAKGRPMYVIVFKRFVRYQSDCSDTELVELWSLALDSIEDKNGRQEGDLFEAMALNAGTYQNVSHLHLKVWMDKHRFRDNWRGHPGFEALREWDRQTKDERRARKEARYKRRDVKYGGARGVTCESSQPEPEPEPEL
eukprot:SAG31_NODE_363_length_16899_cov_9.812976_4_plen_160_part_00